MGSFDEFVTYPSNLNDDQTQSVVNKPITNGDIIAEAIRTKDNVLRCEMERRFLNWCNETHHSVYSTGDKKIWKSEIFEQ